MNPFIKINWQSIVFVILAVGVILLAFGGYLSPVIRIGASPLVAVQKWISTRYMAITEFFREPRDSASLIQKNAELEAEVARLQTKVIELQQRQAETEVLRALLDFAKALPENEYVAATVIGVDPSPFLHYVLIDQGSDDGVRHGMPVVTAKGLVGRVDAVIASAARVQLITDPGLSVNVQFQSNKTKAILTGSLTGDISLELIPQDMALRVGEVVLTSGVGGKFPENILVGQVVNVRRKENDLYQTATLQPVVDFSKIEAVLVIKNFKPVDITPLIPTPNR
ncbi:MAG TPA: rod shape-determining protein MreC [Anaerolineaceae bacterium]